MKQCCLRISRNSGFVFTIGVLLYVIFFQQLIIQTRRNHKNFRLPLDDLDSSDIHEPPHYNNARDTLLKRSNRPLSNAAIASATTTVTSNRKFRVIWPRTSNLKVPYPIWVLSLPKSGTTSMWQYFLCGHQKASHQYIHRQPPLLTQQGSPPVLTGMCMEANVRQGRPPFHNCGDYDVYSDTGVRTR
jgi:hypothetical protein